MDVNDMTGGRVVVLGKTGKNFAAGMSGGIAYVLDENSHLYRNLNKDMISIEKVENKYDIKELKELIEEHVEATGSERGADSGAFPGVSAQIQKDHPE